MQQRGRMYFGSKLANKNKQFYLFSVLKCKFKFAVMAGGFKSGSLPHAKYYSEQIHLPTMHIYGTNDQIIPKGKII